MRPDDSLGMRMLAAVIFFWVAIALVSLVSVDDVEGERQGTTEVVR